MQVRVTQKSKSKNNYITIYETKNSDGYLSNILAGLMDMIETRKEVVFSNLPSKTTQYSLQ